VLTGDPVSTRLRTRAGRPGESAAIVTVLCVALSGIGAAAVPAAAPAAEPAALCIPIVMQCSPKTEPAPTPGTTSPGSPGSDPLGPLLNPTIPEQPQPELDGTAPDSQGAPVPPDADAPIFTLPAAQLGGSSISITGLKSVTAVTVSLADGTRTPVLKVVADDVAVDDFLLDVRKATGPSLVTTADRMELHGHVQVYLDSATAILPNDTPLTFGAATPPPGDELPATLLRVNLGLVGVTADSIVFVSPHQDLKE
jgi:hypothetical protein